MKFVKSLATHRSYPSSSHAPTNRHAPGKRPVIAGERNKQRVAAAKAKLRPQKVADTDSGFLRQARLRKQVTRDKYVDHTLLPGRSSRFVAMHQLDCALEAFGEHLFLGGASKYTFTLQNVNIVYPCWPTSARTNFPLTKAAKKGWGNLEPGASKDPCPFEVASWIALDMVRRGLYYFAAAVMLSFDAYIRPGKLSDLVAGNVVPPPKGVHRKYCHWTLLLHPQESAVPSKVGQFNDSLVVGSHGREWISDLLGRIYSVHPGDLDSQLFDFTLDRFEKEFKVSVSRLGIQKLQLSPHCLRHGGASHDYLFGIRSLSDVQARGCWASYESVRRYAKHGRINRQLNLLTPEQQQTAKQSHLELPRILLKCF